MRGRYLYPQCGSLGLSTTCYLRNTPRNSAEAAIAASLEHNISIFTGGEKVFARENFGHLPSGGFIAVKLEELGFDFESTKDYLIVIDSIKGDAADYSYFAQEHQIVFETAKGQRASLLYDHQPAFSRAGKYSPVIVLAPKILISANLNSYVVFANYRAEGDKRQQSEPLEITLLDEAGKVVLEYKENLILNSAYIFDVKKHLKDRKFGQAPEFFTLTAKSGEAVYAVFTIIRNEATGNIGVEHSLPPDYYVSGDKGRIRDEALRISV